MMENVRTIMTQLVVVGFVAAAVAGHLVSQSYKEGSLVRTGEPLFQVDPRSFQTVLDQTDAKLRLAESQLSQAEAQVSASRAQVEQAVARVAQDEAQVKRAEATQHQTELDVGRYTPLAAARLNLGYTRVASPIDGIAGLRGANIGDFVGPSDATPLTTVSQVDPI